MLISESRKPKKIKLRNAEYYDLTKTFDNLYKDSKENKNFNKLMEIISSDNNILLAYRNIKSNNGSDTPGIDGKTINDLSKISKEKFIRIVKSKFNRYSSCPVRRVDIKKPNGKMRPLGIPTIWDRIVQQCILQVLEPICEAKFHERSNGFRPNRSVEHAMAQCYRMVNLQKLHYVVDIDIEGFFDNVNHCKLRKQMWSLGIRDKKLLCIITEMLKAPIILQDGTKIYPKKGTPQGGILSPLLSNIVLNELDWWIASQWETIPTKKDYVDKISKNTGLKDRTSTYRALRGTNLKEMYIVRYADDFKIFCRDYPSAKKIFCATEKWLKERLGLNISKEKSKIVNLRRTYSEFLGFKFKARRKGKRWVVTSHISEKAIKSMTGKLTNQIKKIQHPRSSENENFEIRMYNTMVMGMHNYYQFATNVSSDMTAVHNVVRKVMKNRLRKRLRKTGEIGNGLIKKKYGSSNCLRFVRGAPRIPISYVQHKNPMYKKYIINKYTPEGRLEIHKSLGVDMKILMKLMRERYINRSMEYMDNRISLYCAQYGKCHVTGIQLEFEDIHCHHKKARSQGGTDEYRNLVIIHKGIHTLIHATRSETVKRYMDKFSLDENMIKKINRLREKLGLGTLHETLIS